MNRKKQASILRTTRYIHRNTGIFLFLIFIFVAITGLLLGWKKNISFIQYPTQTGQAKSIAEWLPMDSIIFIANQQLNLTKGDQYSIKIDKIEARPSKGVVKVIYAEHYHSFQIDAATGDILSSEYRASDLIEHLHDGTWVDRNLNIPGGLFKLAYTTIISLALCTFSITGFWLYYGPKRMRKKRNTNYYTQRT